VNLGHGETLEIKNKKTSRRGSRSGDNGKFGHFTLFCRARQRNVPRITTHVNSSLGGWQQSPAVDML